MLGDHLEKLKHFIGVAKAGSIRKYAIRYNLSQPAISKSIQILESALETSLMQRSRDGIRLTDSGQALYRWADSIYFQSEDVERRIRMESKQRLKGQVKLGTYLSISIYYIPHFFKHVQREQSDVHFTFLSYSSAKLVSELKAGKLDLIISIDPPARRELNHVKLYDDTYSLYRAIGGGAEARNAPIFTLSRAKDSDGRDMVHYLKNASLLQRAYFCSDFEVVKAMVENDAGLAILPDRVAAPLVNNQRIERSGLSPRLVEFGSHSVVLSCNRHRAADHLLRWTTERIVRTVGGSF
jgi:DNA-binding transcriptional LysR family regulator